MLKKQSEFILHSLIKIRANPQKFNLFVAADLLILTIVIRLPFFFKDVINWDESTFILMGQSILDGHLPYTELWVLKPPGLFFICAFFIALLGKSIISIRICGALSVALVSFFTYLIGNTLWNYRTGILGATFFVLLSSLIQEGNATMSEHIALVPLVAALSILVRKKITPRILFFTGILIGSAIMIRLNLAYVSIIIGFFIVFQKPLKAKDIMKRGLAYTAGHFLIISLIYIPYAVTGNQQILWDSVIVASLSYSNSQLSTLQTLKQHLIYIKETISNIEKTLFWISSLVWIGGLAGIIFKIVQFKSFSEEKRRGLLWLTLFLFGTGISILNSGAAHIHYLIQIIPFMSLAAAAFFNTLFSSKARWLTISIVVLALVISVKPVIYRYDQIASRVLENKPLTYGSTFEIAAYLTQENPLKEPIYMMTDHLVYWHLNTKPLTKSTTHPSNISKEYLLNILVDSNASTEAEMTKILSQKPKFIVKKKNVWYLSGKIEARLLLEETLNTDYQLVKEIQKKQIYRRI